MKKLTTNISCKPYGCENILDKDGTVVCTLHALGCPAELPDLPPLLLETSFPTARFIQPSLLWLVEEQLKRIAVLKGT